MHARLVIIATFALTGLGAAHDKQMALTPAEARKAIGKEITIKMGVKAAKDRLEKRGEIYLDAEEDFKDEKNFAVVITRKGAESLKAAGIADPAEHFTGKTIRATGSVKEVDGVPRIEIDDARQIALAEK
jgi:DNA/RNA endonuclease YhcR with UshA esterase domain